MTIKIGLLAALVPMIFLFVPGSFGQHASKVDGLRGLIKIATFESRGNVYIAFFEQLDGYSLSLIQIG